MTNRLLAQPDRNPAQSTALGADELPALFAQAVDRHRAGQVAEATALYDRILALKPDLPEVHNNLGCGLMSVGRLAEAEAAFRRAVALKPDNAEAHSNFADALWGQGKFEEAAAASRQAIRIKPDYAVAHANLGNALNGQGNLDDAAAAFRRAIALKPDFAEAHSNLGNTLRDQSKLDEAVAACRQAIRLRPDLAEAHANLGAALYEQGKLQEAVAAYRQAIVLRPNFAQAYDNLAAALTELGRLPEARQAAEQAIRLAPRNPRYLHHLSGTRRFTARDPYIATMEELAKDPAALSIQDKIELCFALAKAYEDLGLHEASFRQLLAGNALKRTQTSYDEAATLAAMERVREMFTPAVIHTWHKAGEPSLVPVFIVGMPRSGTTLVEQILASHPQVFGAGELKLFRKAVDGIRPAQGGALAFPDVVSTMNGEDFCELGTRYVADLQRLAPVAARVTDKLPLNFLFAGLIHLALPNAAIIHTIRDPVDTCLSCFAKLFSEDNNPTYDLAELGRFYRQYQVLMTHWHRVLPANRILDVRYEDVVTDLEGEAKRMIIHCGLDWDPRCLAFHETERPVRTASATQVRLPIYNKAVGRWRVYEPLLGPLLAELQLTGSADSNRLRDEVRGRQLH